MCFPPSSPFFVIAPASYDATMTELQRWVCSKEQRFIQALFSLPAADAGTSALLIFFRNLKQEKRI
jgi:hypothetical protein